MADQTPKQRSRKLYVGCLEGRWAPELTDRQSVLPVLELLEAQNWIEYFHQSVGTKAQLLGDLNRATQRRYDRFELLYLGFHGSPGKIHIGEEDATLDEIASSLKDGSAGKLIHLASCSTGYTTRKTLASRLARLRKQTRAKTVSAYTRYVDWTESAAFELLLFSWLASYGTTKSGWAFKRVYKEYPDLTRTLGFVTEPDYSR